MITTRKRKYTVKEVISQIITDPDSGESDLDLGDDDNNEWDGSSSSDIDFDAGDNISSDNTRK